MLSWNHTKKTLVILTVIFSIITGQFISAAEVFAAEGEGQAVQEESKEEGSQEANGDENNGQEENPSDTAKLRFMFTSDIHGQITTEDYENGTVFTTGGLSRTASLIKEAKKEANEENTLLFDLGDNMYDYTTDYIYNYDDTLLQPIFKALSLVGYDAITLGNHDFEYTLSYIQKQLKDSGLEDKVVLSNVKDINTGKNIWAENKIFEKQLVTSSGRSMKVKVGVIGETIPSIPNKRENYTGVLQTEGIIKNVEKEVSALKEQGADIIVVIAHSGIGSETVSDTTHNVGYALTKVEGVDAVLCGHGHSDFPSAKGTKYDSFKGVDLTTGLVNGKSLVQIKSRGASLGIADLELSDADNKISIVGRNSLIRSVNANTEVDQTINDCMGEWTKIFLSDCSEILCEIGNQTELQNYFATQEDTDLIQLMNNIKMGYGLNYINNTATEYKNYPVIGVSSYIKYGSGDSRDYIDITGDFKRSNMYDLINYKTKLFLYEMTGAQIREWLEWSAGCYETSGEAVLQKSDFPSFSGEKPLQYALQQRYLNDWKNFFVFDGIEYKIDSSAKPRYDANGYKINDTRRIISLTRNGAAVADTDVFVVASHQVPDNALFNEMDIKRITYISADQYRSYIEEFISKMALTGNLKPIKDNNWSISYSDKYNYVIKSAKNGQDEADRREWLTSSSVGDDGGDSVYWYYLLETDKISQEDSSGPGINAVILNENIMSSKGTIVVQATDLSGVASVKYTKGKYNINDIVWSSAKQVSDGKFSYSKNAIYSILAEDMKGNRSIAYIKTSNIDSNMLAAPVVKPYSNKKKYIEGTAKAGSKIYFQIENGKNYSANVTSKGTFKYKLPSQKAGKRIFVYAVDSKGKTSSRTTVTVKRTGPNKPALNNNIKTNSKVVSGKTNDIYAYPLVLVDDKVLYVPSTNVEELYKKSSFYKKSYKVVVIKMKTEASGAFQFTLPEYPTSHMNVKIKTIDALARCSLQHKVGVTLAAPRKPTVSQVSNLSQTVKVYTAEECTSATVRIDNKKYAATKAKYNKKTGYCYTIKVPRSDSTSIFRIWLTNKVGNSLSVVLHPTEKVPNKPKLDTVKRSAKKITGKVHLVGSKDGENTVKSTKTKVYLYLNGKKHLAKIKSDGTFYLKFKKRKLKPHDKLICFAKNCNGTSLKRTVYIK